MTEVRPRDEVVHPQALPTGQETDFVLVSCAGVPTPSNDPLVLGQQVEFKRKGESALRNSGLNYTVVRPGPIITEPGGYKALVFDQVYCCALFPFVMFRDAPPRGGGLLSWG